MDHDGGSRIAMADHGSRIMTADLESRIMTAALEFTDDGSRMMDHGSRSPSYWTSMKAMSDFMSGMFLSGAEMTIRIPSGFGGLLGSKSSPFNLQDIHDTFL
jgi:hypothetical protein